jgi:hypothetical protein
MENKRQTTEENFLEALRKKSNNEPNLFIYWNLFTILHFGDPDFLEHIVDEYKRFPEDNWWFINFHKALRQCDYFSDSLCFSESLITQEESKRINTILFLRSRIRREMNLEDLDIDDPEYLKLGEELSKLRRKSQIHQRTSISGHLDSILHQCISHGKDELFNFMRSFLVENVELETEES